MEKYLIIADDFTGSNDTGVQLTKRKIPVQVKFETDNNFTADAIVIDTESRNIAGTDAKEKLIHQLSVMPLAKYDYVVKKVDSTLRGNIVEEIQALDLVYHPDLIIFDSALPSLKRTIRNGILFVNGKRALETDLKKDPIKPLKEDNLLNILEKSFPNEDTKLIKPENLKASNFAISEGCRLYVYDSSTDKDMQLIVKKFSKFHKRILWIGSAGIMDAILSIKYPTLPALGLVGSVSKVTREQLNFAAKNGIKIIQVPISEVYSLENYLTYVDKAINELKYNNDVIIASSASCNYEELYKTRANLEAEGLTIDEINSIVQSVLGGICRKVLDKTKISGLFITGGDTAKGFFDGIGASGVNILEEIATGVPLMKITGGNLDGLTIVTKAGAFGNNDLMTYAFKKIKDISSNS